ncbi:hypothetical protein ACWD4G_11065 [Streptomyces sp. NPDC002643]
MTATLGRRSRPSARFGVGGFNRRAGSILADPAGSVAGMEGGLPESDRWIVADAGIQAMLDRNFAEKPRSSADGWVDGVMVFSMGWVRPGPDHHAGEALARRGRHLRPCGHIRWLGRNILDVEVEVEQGAVHFGALRVLARVMSWAVNQV